MKEVTLVGLGGVGSYIAKFLTENEVQVFGIDFDEVERKNLAYTIFEEKDIGLSKVGVLKRKLSNFDGKCLELDRRNVGKFERGQLWVLAVDSLEARQDITKVVLKWIDARAEDDDWQILTWKSRLANSFMIGSNPEMRASCQSEPDERIYRGNVKCARKVTEMVLRYLNRGKIKEHVFNEGGEEWSA